MELVLVSVGVLLVLVVVAGVMDFKARRHRRRLSVDGDAVRNDRRLKGAEANLYRNGDQYGGPYAGGS